MGVVVVFASPCLRGFDKEGKGSCCFEFQRVLALLGWDVGRFKVEEEGCDVEGAR